METRNRESASGGSYEFVMESRTSETPRMLQVNRTSRVSGQRNRSNRLTLSPANWDSW